MSEQTAEAVDAESESEDTPEMINYEQVNQIQHDLQEGDEIREVALDNLWCVESVNDSTGRVTVELLSDVCGMTGEEAGYTETWGHTEVVVSMEENELVYDSDDSEESDGSEEEEVEVSEEDTDSEEEVEAEEETTDDTTEDDESEDVSEDTDDLDEATFQELYDTAKELGISGRSDMDSDELRTAIRDF